MKNLLKGLRKVNYNFSVNLPKYDIKKDYYRILELEKNADKTELKKAYYRLAKKHHPDQNISADKDKIKLINEAY